MPAPTVAWLGDGLVPFERASVPLEDRGLQFGESLYEVLPVTAGRPRLVREHGGRLRAGAAQIGLSGAPDDAAWQEIARSLCEAEGEVEALLYAQLTGGTAPRVHAPTTRPSPTFFAYVRRHRYPRPPEVERGLTAMTLEDPRWARCDIKTTMLLPAVLAKYEAARRGADEALFVSRDGLVLEGSSSNVFIVERGIVIGVPQSPDILPGITRALLEQACRATGATLRAEPIPLARLREADEVFLTSTSRLAMPVLGLDGQPLASGRAGPVAQALASQMRRDLEIE